jgi:putative tryptophan/tyrosine transport system substrate-binding protein
MVETGIVGSLAPPGGNVTGLTKLTPELATKRLDLVTEMVSGLSRVAVLWDPGYSDFAADWRELQATARAKSVTERSIFHRWGANWFGCGRGANAATRGSVNLVT